MSSERFNISREYLERRREKAKEEAFSLVISLQMQINKSLTFCIKGGFAS